MVSVIEVKEAWEKNVDFFDRLLDMIATEFFESKYFPINLILFDCNFVLYLGRYLVL